jgi:pre-mRNA-splicing factor CWC22
LEILVLLLDGPDLSNDNVQLGIGFLKECGQKLSEVYPRGLHSVFSVLRNLLRESSLDQRTQSMIEALFDMREDHFKAYPSIPTGLDLVYENDQYTHMITLDDKCEPEAMLGIIYIQ